MPNVRTMSPVGSTNVATIEKQMAGGYQAQGFALAQTIKAITVSTAQQLARCVMTAFDYGNEARDECIRDLNAWRKQLTEAAKGNGNLEAGGMDERSRGRIARSASTRVSEFSAVMLAMNNGFTRETLREKAGVADVEHVGFHTIVELARAFNQSGATRAGRPSDPFAVKLAKWLERQQAEGTDAEVKARVVNMLAEVILPVAGDDKAAEQIAHNRRADDKA